MDFKKLGTFIRILGVLVLGYGAIQLVTNQPKSFKPSTVQREGLGGLLGSIVESLKGMDIQSENESRAITRDQAVKVMIAGGIVVFAGYAVSNSANKSSST